MEGESIIEDDKRSELAFNIFTVMLVMPELYEKMREHCPDDFGLENGLSREDCTASECKRCWEEACKQAMKGE